MSFYIDYETTQTLDLACEEIFQIVGQAVLEAEHCPFEAEVNLILTDNKAIREINNEQRGKDTPTDVLSFPMISFQESGDFSVISESENEYFEPDTGELLLGDIVISMDKVKEQAMAYGHSVKREFAFLIAHSMLHLVGYDHETEQEAMVMEYKQNQILTGLSINR